MPATGVFFTLPPVFFSAFQSLIPDGQSLLFHDHLPAIDAFRLRAKRPRSAKLREHRPSSPLDGSPPRCVGSARQNHGRGQASSEAAARPARGSPPAGGRMPPKPAARRKTASAAREKHSPHAPAPHLWINGLFDAPPHPGLFIPSLLPVKTGMPPAKTERPVPDEKPPRLPKAFPCPLLFTSLSLFSRMSPVRLRRRKKQRHGFVRRPHDLFSIASSFTRL